MSGGWQHSTGHQRTSTAAWKRLSPRVIARDGGVCQLRYDCCIGTATEADHIVSPLAGGTDDEANLRAVCVPCHRRRTSAQGNAARVRQARPAERHPGLRA